MEFYTKISLVNSTLFSAYLDALYINKNVMLCAQRGLNNNPCLVQVTFCHLSQLSFIVQSENFWTSALALSSVLCA